MLIFLITLLIRKILDARRTGESQRQIDISELLAQVSSYRKQGDTENIIVTLEQLCSKYPEAKHFIMLADEYAAAGDTDKALELCKKAISLDPTNAYAYLNTGKLTIEKGNPFSARSFLSKSIDLMPQTDTCYGEAQAYYALACAGCGDMTEAQRALRRAEAAGYAECEKIRAQLEAEK